MPTFRKANPAMTVKPIYIILIFSLAILHKDISGQTQNPRYNFKHLNVQTGLAQNIVYHFLQDSRGYMWLGTRNGLALYDGTRTINFLYNEGNKKSISSNFITRIMEDSLHRVWVSTDAGISRYNRSDNSFSNFSVLPESNKKENVYCVLLGFVNDHELWVLETKTKSIRTFNTITLIIDSLTSTPAVDGTLWYDSLNNTHHIWTYLSSGTIHYVFKDKMLLKKETFFTGENKKQDEPVLQVVHVLPKNDSVTWLSTTAGLIELNPHNHKYIFYKTGEGQPVRELRYAAIAPNGLLWAATGNNGVYTFDLKTKKIIDNYRYYRLDPFSICSNNIVSLYFDRLGNIWCGSYGQGASYTNVEKKYFQKSLTRNESEKWEGNNNVHWTGYDNAGSLWCIIDGEAGLRKLNKDRHMLEYREPVLENGKKFTGRFYKVLFDGSHLAWCIGTDGLFRYDLVSNRLQKMVYPLLSADLFGSNWIQDMIRLTDQSFLFCTFGGLYRMTEKKGKYNIQPFSELNKKKYISFEAIYQDEGGAIYVKDIADGLYIIKPPEKQNDDTAIHSILFPPQINQFYTDTINNSLLLATGMGLYRLNRSDYSFKKIDFNPAVPFLSISGLMKTTGKLWLFGEKGLFCFDEKKNTARTFTVEDGLPANEFNLSANIFSSGECIAGTTNGLVSFFPDKLQDKVYPPVVQLTNIYVNDASAGFVPNPQEIDKINLSHKQNTFSFDFAPIAFQNAAGCSFEYRLQDYDEGWIRSGNARYTRYSKIPPGHYVFQLRAIDVNGIISPYNKTLEIKIAKAFWQMILFKIAMLLILLLLAWLVLKWYLQRNIRKHKLEFEKQQAVEKERTRIATDMHDDLGAGLSKIRFLSETVQRNISEKAHEPTLQNIASSSVELVDKFNEIIWAMNEKNNSLEDLLYYIRNYTAKYCTENNLDYEIALPDDVPSVLVSGELRRHVFLTVKESLHNVVKHANAGKVWVHIQLNTGINITIRDNGKGFTIAEMKNKGNGLANMYQRIKDLNGKLLIENEGGTIIKIAVPVANT
jgi:signal transduction histidine kinase/ligand-binding sensor domain-containing protein